MSRVFVVLAALMCLIPLSAAADLSGLARVRADGSAVRDTSTGARLVLRLSQGVPYRLFTLDDPRRLVIDFNEVDWAGLDTAAFDRSRRVSAVRVGLFRTGWTRMVIDLDAALAVTSATLEKDVDLGVQLVVALAPVSAEDYAAKAGPPEGALIVQNSSAVALPKAAADGISTVVLDPGHGGIDPGAEADGEVEAALMLTFARELQEALLRAGGFRVILTREDDEFVPLETRVSIARRAGADVFLSLHADALVEGRASGATIYTLSDKASDQASRKLAERHDRGDLLAGVDLSGSDDRIAAVLMDMARTETEPRTNMLADALVAGMSQTVGMHKRPKLQAGFSVLKSPDIPSVLIELGFLSSPRDQARLKDAEWRARAAAGIVSGLQNWIAEDAALRPLLRK